MGVDSFREHEAFAREAEEALHPQRKLIAALMHSRALADGDVAQAIQQLTEVAARALRVGRVSVWRLRTGHEGAQLECVDLFERTTACHSSGAVIPEPAAPRYFQALAQERAICAHEAHHDPRTSEFADGVLRPANIHALLDAPVFVRGQMIAVVSFEHTESARRWHFWEELIAGTCSDFVALVLEAQGWASAERALRNERDRLEAKVDQRTAALVASENGLRTLLEVTPVGLVLMTLPTHSALFVNARCLELFDAPTDVPLGPHLAEAWVHHEDRARFLAAAGNGIRGMEAELKTRAGRTFWARIAAAPIAWNDTPAALVSIDDISVQKRAELQLRELATRDVLTGVHNRRSLIDAGGNEIERARRYQRPFSAAMIDIDHFKRVNDSHGHAVGDEILRAVVRVINDLLRGSDLLGRWGGEEFVVLLPETDAAAATRVLERIRTALAEQPQHAGGVDIAVTISIGVAEWAGIESLASLVERADQACYAAKRAGRNRSEQALPR